MHVLKLFNILILKACYVVYNRYEPINPLFNLLLLIGTPLLALNLVSLGQLTFSDIFHVLATHWGLLLLCTTAYRLSPFHPLSHYPGPIAARISKFYHVFFSLRGDAHTVIRRWHDQHGDVVRIGKRSCGVFS